jgi:translocation and assembly module TamB
MKKKKLNFAFAIFFSLVSVSLFAGVMFLESDYFAGIVKKTISERSPKSLGVVGDFDNIKLYFFPPGIGVTSPRVKVQKNNISKLPIDATIEADELRLHFESIQMLSGTLQVSKVVIKEGSVVASIGAEAFAPKQAKKKSNPLSWNELLELQINGIELQNTFLSLEIETPDQPTKKIKSEFVVKHLSAHKEKVQKHGKLQTVGLVNAVKLDIPKDVLQIPVHAATELEWDLTLTDTGVDLSLLRLQLFGLELSTKGKILGNILDPKVALGFQLDAKLNSDLEEFFSVNEISNDAKGEVEAELKVTGDLKDIQKTLKGKYQLVGKNLQWKDASVADLSGSGQLDLARNEIEIENISLFENENHQIGGEVKITDSVLSLKSPLEGLKAKINIRKAPMHWLGGAVLGAVYPLQGEISGNVTVASSQSKLEINPDLEVKNFALTNQSIKKKKPLHFILKPKEIVQVKGHVVSQAGKVNFQQVQVLLKGTKLDVKGTIGSQEGIDLQANGALDLSDFNELSEIPIRGTGNLFAHVHGDGDGVVIDFDPDLKNAEYLNLNIGEVKGRITYDDHADELRFSNIHAKLNKTFYSLNEGLVDLSDESELRLPFIIHSGRVEDLIQILDSMVKKISWFPSELKGEAHGSVLLHGKTSFSEMMIDSNLEGVDWVLMGERARKIKMNLGYDRGTYFARNVTLSKTSGSIKGMIEFNSKNDQMNWSFATDSFSLIDLDFFERLEIPARSKIEIKSTGTGKINHLVSNTSGRIFQTQIKGEVLDPSTFNLDVSESTLRANLDVFGKRLHTSLKYALIPKQPSSLNIEFNDFDFSPAILIMNPKLLDDPNLQGLVDGRFQFDFLSTQSELARGEIFLKKYVLKKTGFSLNLVEPIHTAIQLGYFKIEPTHFKFNEGQLVLAGDGKGGDIDLTLKGKTDLAIAEMFSSSVQKVNGKADTELRISGPLKNIRINGDLNFSNAYLMMRFLQTPFEEMDGSIRIRQNVIFIENLDSYLGEEVFSLSGKIETFTDQFPSLDLKAEFDDNKVKMLPLELVQAKGTAYIKGDRPPYQITGSLEVPQALWTKSFSQSSGSSNNADRFAPTDTDKQSSSDLFNLDLMVNAPQGFIVRNEVMDSEFRGKVRLIGAVDNPNLLGEGHLVQGKVLFRDRPFIMESVKVVFDDPYTMNPKFNAVAISEINQYKVRVLAYGKSSSWKAEFNSTPYLSEGEIFSLLASGLTSADNSRFRNRDRSYVNQGEAASLVLHSMDFGKDVQSKTGFQFDVEEAVDAQSANSIFTPQSNTDNVAAPKLVIKRQVGRKIGVSFGSTVGVGNQVQREVNAEYKLSNTVSALGVWNNIEEANTRETRTSFGVDFKWNKKFK